MELRPTTSTAPRRRVVKAERREGAWGVCGGCKGRWYELTLECGHWLERGARYNPTGPRGWGSMHHPPPVSHMLPPPKRVRCTRCAK